MGLGSEDLEQMQIPMFDGEFRVASGMIIGRHRSAEALG